MVNANTPFRKVNRRLRAPTRVEINAALDKLWPIAVVTAIGVLAKLLESLLWRIQ